MADNHQSIESTVRAIEKWGRMGFIVSVVFGPRSGTSEAIYSVAVINTFTGQEFPKPFAASEFCTIATILNTEIPLLLDESEADIDNTDTERNPE